MQQPASWRRQNLRNKLVITLVDLEFRSVASPFCWHHDLVADLQLVHVGPSKDAAFEAYSSKDGLFR